MIKWRIAPSRNLFIVYKTISPTASSHHTGSRATGCQYPDTIPYCRNSVPICTQGEQAVTPYGTFLCCKPNNWFIF